MIAVFYYHFPICLKVALDNSVSALFLLLRLLDKRKRIKRRCQP